MFQYDCFPNVDHGLPNLFMLRTSEVRVLLSKGGMAQPKGSCEDQDPILKAQAQTKKYDFRSKVLGRNPTQLGWGVYYRALEK